MPTNIGKIVLGVLLWNWLHSGCSLCSAEAVAEPVGQPPCRVVQQGNRVELCSPSFVFRLDTADGLRAQSWENRLTARTLELGNGPELETDIGLPDNPLPTPPLEVSTVQVNTQGEAGEAVFTLAASAPALTILVTYRWDAREPVSVRGVGRMRLFDKPRDCETLEEILGERDGGERGTVALIDKSKRRCLTSRIVRSPSNCPASTTGPNQPESPRYVYGYDAQGNQTLLRDPLGRETWFTSDVQNRQVSRTLPLGFGDDGRRGTGDDPVSWTPATDLPSDMPFTERMTCDTLGRQHLHISFEGVVTEHVYSDTPGRLIAERFFDNLL